MHFWSVTKKRELSGERKVCKEDVALSDINCSKGKTRFVVCIICNAPMALMSKFIIFGGYLKPHLHCITYANQGNIVKTTWLVLAVALIKNIMIAFGNWGSYAWPVYRVLFQKFVSLKILVRWNRSILTNHCTVEIENFEISNNLGSDK